MKGTYFDFGFLGSRGVLVEKWVNQYTYYSDLYMFGETLSNETAG